MLERNFEACMVLFQHPDIEVRASDVHGFGVFACQPIDAGVLLEECHFFDVPMENYRRIEFVCPEFAANFYCWPLGGRETAALLLGNGSIYNHSDQPNTEISCDARRRLYVFKTLQPIGADQELFVSYGEFWWMTRHRVSKH